MSFFMGWEINPSEGQALQFVWLIHKNRCFQEGEFVVWNISSATQ